MIGQKMTIEPLLNYVSAFIDVPAEEAMLWSHYFKSSEFPKSTILEKENKIAQNLYFLTEGFIRSFHFEDGTEITTQIVDKGNFITSFESFNSKSISKENIECISGCKVLYITKSDYEVLHNDSLIWSLVCKKVYEKTIAFNQQRTTDLLTLSAEKRYSNLLKEQPEIIQNVPIQYIASYIGIKPESLSRIRRKIIS